METGVCNWYIQFTGSCNIKQGNAQLTMKCICFVVNASEKQQNVYCNKIAWCCHTFIHSGSEDIDVPCFLGYKTEVLIRLIIRI